MLLTNEIKAAPNKILTSKSSNCSKINFHKGFPSSVGNSLSKQNVRK